MENSKKGEAQSSRQIKRRYSSMPEVARKLQADEMGFISGMSEYIEILRAQPPEEAEKTAKEALIRTGVITKDGKIKKSIVSWE